MQLLHGLIPIVYGIPPITDLSFEKRIGVFELIRQPFGFLQFINSTSFFMSIEVEFDFFSKFVAQILK